MQILWLEAKHKLGEKKSFRVEQPWVTAVNVLTAAAQGPFNFFFQKLNEVKTESHTSGHQTYQGVYLIIV